MVISSTNSGPNLGNNGANVSAVSTTRQSHLGAFSRSHYGPVGDSNQRANISANIRQSHKGANDSSSDADADGRAHTGTHHIQRDHSAWCQRQFHLRHCAHPDGDHVLSVFHCIDQLFGYCTRRRHCRPRNIQGQPRQWEQHLDQLESVQQPRILCGRP